ncbi:MAG: trypsin-like peptidase domain-containing protein [Nibricoccus sp.]
MLTKPHLAALFASLTALFTISALSCSAQEAPAPQQPPAEEPPSATGTAIPAADAQKTMVENSVVKIFAQVRRPELMKPWTKQAPQEVTGSGVVIEGKRILTNAHVVLYASQVQIQASQSGDKLSATVEREMVAPGIDLAVLKLEDESFFDTHPPLPRVSSLPQVKDNVLVYGFPTGGTSLSITKGIVSRIEFAGYNFPVSGLRVQIDAAINPGNSGGPALVGDKVIGLAFSHLSNAQNIGYIIPSEEIDLFLKDIADGRYDGKPGVFDEFQTLENPALRSFLKVDKSISGMVVHEPFSSDSSYPLKKWDIVSKIGSVKVDDQGMVKVEGGPRLRMAYMVQKLAQGGKLPLTIIRGGKELNIDLPVSPENPRVISHLRGAYPSYFVCGPIVFSVASEELTGIVASNNQALAVFSVLGSPLITRRSDKPAFPGEQLVIIPAPFFPHKLSKGYSNQTLRVVESVNGIPVKNLLHLVELIRSSKDEFLVFEFAGRGGEAPVFPRAELLASTEEILTDNGIRALGSSDVVAAWEKADPGPQAVAPKGPEAASSKSAPAPAAKPKAKSTEK